ncbi:multicopper oxidase domain-containing protein, partial [Moorena bouillonii]|uniref:multicopper oxidase domain-containing protein n=1 Tax=Moorena bouillonii TaxID=207920 RepID=UPI0013012140
LLYPLLHNGYTRSVPPLVYSDITGEEYCQKGYIDQENSEYCQPEPVNRLFLINGQAFGEPDTEPIQVDAEQTEDWTLINQTKAHHTFHIHQTHFVVTEYENNPDAPTEIYQPTESPRLPIGELTYRDNIDLPPGQQVKVRIPFAQTQEIVTGGEDKGEFVFHCHILAHEDLGMMRKVCASNGASVPCPED